LCTALRRRPRQTQASGARPDRTSTSLFGLDYLLKAIDNYLSTRDSAFLSLARDSAALVNSIDRFF